MVTPEMDTNVIDATGQRWKLIALEVVAVLAGALMSYSLWQIDHLEADRFALLMGGGVLIGLGAFVWRCFSLRCPKCRAAWFWRAVSRQSRNTWQIWLSEMTACPECEQRARCRSS